MSLPPRAVPIKFVIDDDATVVKAYPNISHPSPDAPILYDFYVDSSLEAWVTLEDTDDDNFGWKTYFSRRSFRQGVTRASQSSRVLIQGQKPSQKKNKRNKKKKSKAKKKLGITSEEEYAPFVKTSFTLRDYDPKGFFGNDFSEDDLAEGELTQCYRFSWVDE